ncbi:MAG: hypothetical protein ACI97A_000814 [Planctomycetota bacterium]|jgi:hypothetical protein
MKELIPKRLTEADAQLLKSWFVEETGLQNELNEMLSSMEKHIVRHDVRSLETHLVATSGVLSRMENLEAKRGKILGHLTRAGNLKAGKGVLEKLVELVPVSHREELAGLCTTLQAAGQDVRTKSNRSGMLARTAIDVNEDIVRGLFSVDSNAATYDRRGSKTRQAEMILDRSI